jgi:hypothetical protein
MIDKLKAAWPVIVAVAVVLSGVATFVQARLPKDAAGNVQPPVHWGAFIWRVVVDFLAWIPQSGKWGAFGPVNIPGLPSLGDKPNKPGLLLVLILPGFFVAGCCPTWAASSYKGLTIGVNANALAATQLPPACEKATLAAVAAAPTREAGQKALDDISADCDKAGKAIEAVGLTFKAARDGVKDVGVAIASKGSVLPLIIAAIDAYTNLAPILEKYGIKLPSLPGGF